MILCSFVLHLIDYHHKDISSRLCKSNAHRSEYSRKTQMTLESQAQ